LNLLRKRGRTRGTFWHGYWRKARVKLRWFQRMHEAMASLSELPTRCALAPENKEFPFEVRQLLFGSKLQR
jgi:hypothetical protein